ncbi:Protoporphyrinogen oxidase [Mycena kentingensis (nom. inval.)]|nr:Protoporphyrinogen oxidase [Mycena kentingensis (nom. inval.)]
MAPSCLRSTLAALFVFLSLALLPSTHAIKFTLAPYRFPASKCIWNPAHNNALVIVTANVGPGPNQRVDIEIIDSSGQKNVYLSKRNINAETRLAITTHAEGEVGVCFKNFLDKSVPQDKAAKLHRVIDLDVDIGAEAVDYNAIANQESLSGLETEMRKLEGLLKEIVDEMGYLKKREERFASTNESTQERVQNFAWFTVVALAGLGAWQILHLRSFFKRNGLSSAFHLSRRFPSSIVTLIDKNKRLGGWAAHSERVPLPSGGSVLLEGGPRTLRPNSYAVLELINLLGLSDAVITTPKSSPAAKNRYLHVPGTPGIYKIPGLTPSFLWAELRFFITPGIVGDLVRGWNRPPDVQDESFEEFMVRRGHADTARVLGSALVHGIYAADARRLSVRAAFPMLWEAEERGKGRVLWGLLGRSKTEKEEARLKLEETLAGYELGDMRTRVDGAAVYSFREGMSTLTSSLSAALKTRPNVRVLEGASVASLTPREDDFEITTNASNPLYPTHVVSALPLPKLKTILPSEHPLPHLTANPTSSVTAINLVFPVAPGKLFPRGFGYLVCRPEYDYPADDAGILGVTFDSESLAAQDDARGQQLSKVTVMLGGPHNRYQNVDTALEVVLAHLRYQLNWRKPLPEPVVTRVWEHRECIPTPTVGHLQRMEELKVTLNSNGSPWAGRMEVVGAGVKGVSMADCVESGRLVGREW